jgi:hypothetical protein
MLDGHIFERSNKTCMKTSASFGSKSSLLRSRRMTYFLRIITLCLLLLLGGYGLFHHLLFGHAQGQPIPSTIFLDTSAPTFELRTRGTSGSVSYTVVASSGATMTQGRIAASGSQINLTLPQLPDDYYLLQVTDQTNASATSQSIPFAVLAPFTQQTNSPFGVDIHFTAGDNPGLTQLITTMGATSIRDDASWSMIERSPSSYSFNNFDSYMQRLQESNISPLLILDYNNRFYDNNQTPYDNAGLQAFASYAQALVKHYGSQLKAVEVYNEYNGQFSIGPCARKASCYVDLLRATYQAVKAVRPDVTVVGGAVFMDDTSWFKQVFAAGGLAYMDAVSDHPYSLLSIPSPEVQGLEKDMQGLQQLIQQYNNGQSKPIWITEIGWTSARLHVSEQTQANYVIRSAVLSLAAGVQKIFWYDLLNGGSNDSAFEQNFGLLNRPDADGLYTPKLGYAAYAVLARELAGRSFLNRESVIPSIFDMRFSGNLRVLWSTPLHQNVVLATNSPVIAISLTGHVQTLKPLDGQIVLSLSAEPIYIQGNVSGVSWHW